MGGGRTLAVVLGLFSFASGKISGAEAVTPSSALFAGRASYINNAEPEPAGQLDVEEDVTFTRSLHSDYLEFPLTLTYGILTDWDASISIGGQWQSYKASKGTRQTAYGFSDMPLCSRYKLLDQERFFASQSVELEIKLPTASRSKQLGTGNPDYDLTWLVSKDFTDQITGDFNLGYTWLGDGIQGPLRDQLHYGAAVEYIATERLSLVGQVITSVPSARMKNTEVALSASVGWQLARNWQAHASFTKGVGSGSRVIDISGTVGITWSFGRAD